MSLREEQCKKVCRILDDDLANRPTERDSLIIAVQLAFESLSEPHWIPCSERLPEDDVDVFIYLFGNHPYIACRYKGRWYTDGFEVDTDEEPFAWMPLPSPFKWGVTE